jgi:hypothetical protein
MNKTADDILSKLRVERDELFAAAEKLLEAMARDPHSVDPADKFVFQLLGWSKDDIQRELELVSAALRWKPLAGTSAEYAEAVETLDALQKTIPDECERIQGQIEKLNQKLASERRKLTFAEQALQRMENARSNLRNVVPARVKKLFDDRMVQIRSSTKAARLRELTARKRTIAGVLRDLSPITDKNFRAIILHSEAVKLQGLTPPPSKIGSERSIDETVWNRYLAQLRDELPTIEPELRELQTEFDDELAEAESILDYYLQDQK